MNQKLVYKLIKIESSLLCFIVFINKENKMKKIIKTLLISTGLTVGLASNLVVAQERVFFGIATGGTGGT